LKGKKDINIGDLIKRTVSPGRGKVGIVVALGADEHQAILSNWVRVRYVADSGYEWIQKSGVELITKHETKRR